MSAAKLLTLCLICGFGTLVICGKERSYKTLYLDVPLDHFSFVTNKTFKLRYLVNDSYWNPENGPILFYTGNEGSIETFAKHTGLIWEMAPELNASIVFAEHRYYGLSMPFGNESLSKTNIGYLTSSQALADYVDVISFLLKDKSDDERNPVIAIGGSYGGMLSAYMRMKYPHIVVGAIAASAPILQFQGLTDCNAFYKIVTDVFKVENKNCVTNIKKTWAVLRSNLSTQKGKDWISSYYKLCKPFKSDDDAIQLFKDWVTDIYGNLAMVNYPYANDFIANLPAYPVANMCQYIKNTSLSDQHLLEALFNSISVYTNYTGKTKCNDLQGTYGDGLDDKTWDYQACTEMVMPMCTNGNEDMFENDPWNEEKFNNECIKKWNVAPSYQLPIKEYGGKQLKYTSNIIFSNGLKDPWSGGGVLKNLSESVLAILIPEGAHHLDLMDSNLLDPASVTQARIFHKSAIQQWIKNYHKGKDNSG